MTTFDLHLKRHQLLRLFPAAWDALLASHLDLSVRPWLGEWARHGWPLIVRRPLPGEASRVPVGLPLPPSEGKRRIALQVRFADIASVAPLPRLSDVMGVAPQSWRPTLRQLVELAQIYQVRCGVFGSLAWQRLTGLTYVGVGSDLDIVWTLPHRALITQFFASMAEIESHAPMRFDGELWREDGACVSWRELRSGTAELAVKTMTDVRLCSVVDFIGS
jgi:phosphoribosyl-dephospho-CoA transferase